MAQVFKTGSETIVHDGWMHREPALSGAERRLFQQRIAEARKLKQTTNPREHGPITAALREAHEADASEGEGGAERARCASQRLADLIAVLEAGRPVPAPTASPASPAAAPAVAPLALTAPVAERAAKRRRAA